VVAVKIIGRKVIAVAMDKLVCPFDGEPCYDKGRCGGYCGHCNVFHASCGRFDSVRFANDASLRAGFKVGAK
jgi:hypothetical protein